MHAPAPPARSSRATVLIPFGIVTMVWGSTWFVIRDQISEVPASWSVTYRFVVAGTAMAILALIRREPFPRDRRGLRFALLLGLAQFVGNFNFVYRAEEHITSGIVAVVFALLLVPNAVLSRIFLGQRMSRQLLIGSGIAMAGVALLFLHEAHAAPQGPAEVVLGVALTLAAIMSASTANVMQASETAKAYPMIPMLALAMLLGAAMDAVLGFVTAGPPVIEASATYILGTLYLGLFGSAVTFPLYFGLLRQIGPARAAYISVIVPVIAMLISTAFEGYRWTWLAAGGSVLVAAGLVTALRAKRPVRQVMEGAGTAE